MKTYAFGGTIYKAKSKDEVLRRLGIPVRTESLKEVIKISRHPKTKTHEKLERKSKTNVR